MNECKPLDAGCSARIRACPDTGEEDNAGSSGGRSSRARRRQRDDRRGGGSGVDRQLAGRRRGRAVQVDPMKPTLKAPGSERLKLICHDLLSNFAFKIYSRCYSVAKKAGAPTLPLPVTTPQDAIAAAVAAAAADFVAAAHKDGGDAQMHEAAAAEAAADDNASASSGRT